MIFLHPSISSILLKTVKDPSQLQIPNTPFAKWHPVLDKIPFSVNNIREKLHKLQCLPYERRLVNNTPTSLMEFTWMVLEHMNEWRKPCHQFNWYMVQFKLFEWHHSLLGSEYKVHFTYCHCCVNIKYAKRNFPSSFGFLLWCYFLSVNFTHNIISQSNERGKYAYTVKIDPEYPIIHIQNTKKLSEAELFLKISIFLIDSLNLAATAT